MPHRILPSVLIGLSLLLGAAGVAGKSMPSAPTARDGSLLLQDTVARRAEAHRFSDRGPYVAERYAAVGCLGEIWLLELHRNGEAADLLPGAEGYLLDGRVHDGFPAFRLFVERVALFAGLRAGQPRVFAFREAGRCGLARQVLAS